MPQEGIRIIRNVGVARLAYTHFSCIYYALDDITYLLPNLPVKSLSPLGDSELCLYSDIPVSTNPLWLDFEPACILVNDTNDLVETQVRPDGCSATKFSYYLGIE